MWVSQGRPLIREAVAIISVAIAAAATWLLWERLEPAFTPLLLVAVTFSAWYGGLYGGLLAALLAALATAVLLRHLGQPASPFGLTSAIWTASFLFIGLLTGALNAMRQRAERLLNERELRLRLVSDQIPAALWSTDPDLRLTSTVGAGLPMVNANDPLSVSDVFSSTRDDSGKIAEQAHRQALAGKLSRYEMEMAGGVYQCHVEPLHSPQGQIIGVVGVALDITSRKRAEEHLKQAWDQAKHARKAAEAASKAKDQFLAMLSHELRTPLTPALIAASAMEQRSDLPETVHDDIAMIRRNIELEAVLIDDLLDLTRVSRGKLQLELHPIDVHKVLHRAIETCSPDIRDKRIDLAIEMSAGKTQVMADASRLQQVFWNLIKNAVKFTPEGGRLTVRSSNVGDDHPITGKPQLLIEIIDTGIGIEPQILPTIFQAFEQGSVSVTREFGGLGLGLAISKSLVEAHGGRIWAHSEGRDRGSTFRVEMQTIMAPASPDESPAPRPRALGSKNLRILLVEDHADTRRLMGRLLAARGYQIRTAGSVASALRELESDPVDLLLSDLALPDGTGMDLMRYLREGGISQPIKAIALSGFGMEEDIRRSHEAGFATHLTKPVDLRLLEEAIDEVTRHAQGAL